MQTRALADEIHHRKDFFLQVGIVRLNIFGRPVAKRHRAGDDLRTCRRSPDKLALCNLRVMINTAPEHDVIQIATAKQRRKLAVMTKGIGEIAHHHGVAQFTRGKYAVLQVADNRFAVNVKRIRLGVPRANIKPLVFDELLQAVSILRIDGQKILNNRGLSVEMVTGVIGVMF